MGEGGLLVREGDFIFHILSFSRGQVSAAASVGPGRCPPGTRTPLAPPRAYLALIRCFILCLLKAGLASPFGGAGGAGSGGVSFREIPTPCPLPLLQYVREVGLPQREGEIILYISFQRGAMVASGDRPSPTEAAAETKLPL